METKEKLKIIFDNIGTFTTEFPPQKTKQQPRITEEEAWSKMWSYFLKTGDYMRKAINTMEKPYATR